MSSQEKNVLAYLISTILTFALYFLWVGRRHASGAFAGEAGNMLLGRAVLGMIGVGVVLAIVLQILAAILNAMITGDKQQLDFEDERDRMIRFRSLEISYYLQGAVLIAAMILLARGGSTFAVINTIVAAFAVAALSESLVRLFLYRRDA